MDISIFLFLCICFILIFLIGSIIEKVKVPWIFAALIVGAALAIKNPFSHIPKDASFNWLADLGMYFLLFIIGLEIDLSAMKKLGRLIVKVTAATIVLSTLFGSLFIHYVFDTDWITSVLVSLSFATVGEAILIPILDEFKIIHTKLGQIIIGVATLDDAFELITLFWLSILLSTKGESQVNLNQEIAAIIFLIILSVLFFTIKKIIPKIKIPNYPGLVVFFMLIILFTYIGIGELAGMEALAAILAGLVIKYLVTAEQCETLKVHTKLLTYGFLGPIFFLKIGMEMNMSYLVDNIILVLLITLISKVAKITGSVLSARKELGIKQSLLLGIGLSIRFRTSIIVISVLYENGLIDTALYSIIIASSILFKFIVPPLFANLLVKWNIAYNTT